MVHKLIEIIGREAELFEKFLLLLEEQQQALVTNDLEQIKATTENQREMIISSQILNNEREKLIEEIKIANAYEGDLSVTKLLEMVDENQAQQLVKLQKLIYSLHDQITEVRNQNANLLNRSREYIEKMMDMLAKINTPAGSYSQPGNSGNETSKSNALAFDRRA